MSKKIDIYQKSEIKSKEDKKNQAIDKIIENQNHWNDRTMENKELEHLDVLVNGEGTTRYGEFISSYFAWTGLNRQKTRAEELNNMTKRKL